MLRSVTLRSFSTSLQHLVIERPFPRVALVRLNRVKQLNALCDGLIGELNDETMKLDKDSEVGCIVITGNGRAFAAGADIKEMRPRDYVGSYKDNALAQW